MSITGNNEINENYAWVYDPESLPPSIWKEKNIREDFRRAASQ